MAAFVDGEEEPPSTVNFVSFSEDLAGADRRYRAAVGDWEQTWRAVLNGGIVINEPMANRTDLGVGDHLPVQTDRGLRNFEIVGVSIDFDVNMTAFTAADVFEAFFDDSDPSAVAIFVEPGVNVDETVSAMRAEFAGQQELLISSNRGLRTNAIAIFDRTFAITVALQLLATIVAFIGILSTLMSLQLERTREIGVLRANGMTRRQLWRLSLLETGLIGSTAGLIALPVGFVLALVLILHHQPCARLAGRWKCSCCRANLCRRFWSRWWRRCWRGFTRRGAWGRCSRQRLCGRSKLGYCLLLTAYCLLLL